MKKILRIISKGLKAIRAGHRKIIIALLIIIAAGTLSFFCKSLFITAIVNNKPISRLSFIRDLEKQAGKSVLENKIAEILVLQEAKKQKVEISKEEIDNKVKEIETQVESNQQKLDDLLSAQGQTREDLKQQIGLKLLVEKLLSSQIQITDKDIQDYFESNKANYPKGTTLQSQKEEIKNYLFQQGLTEKLQPWLTELKNKANIHYFINF